MAGDVIGAATPAAATAEGTPAPPKPPAHSHQLRVGVAYGVLGVALAGAIAGLIVVLTRPTHKAEPARAWSSWSPTTTTADTATVTKEIAQHVQGEYKFKDGKAVVAVIGHKPTVGNSLPVSVVALRGQTNAPGQIVAHNADHTWMYELCGLGGTQSQCAIERGTPTVARGRLVRKEALELALYTFKYAPEVDSVLAFLPPKPPVTSATPRYAIYLQKSDLHSQLSHPFSTTFPEPQGPLSNVVLPKEVASVDRIVDNRVFQLAGGEQLQDGTFALVLDPPTAGG
jgi:hypothetical protein